MTWNLEAIVGNKRTREETKREPSPEVDAPKTPIRIKSDSSDQNTAESESCNWMKATRTRRVGGYRVTDQGFRSRELVGTAVEMTADDSESLSN